MSELTSALHGWLREHGGAIEEFDWDSIHDFAATFLQPRLADAEAAVAKVARVSDLLRRAELQDEGVVSCDFAGNRWTTPISQDDLREALRGDQ